MREVVRHAVVREGIVLFGRINWLKWLEASRSVLKRPCFYGNFIIGKHDWLMNTIYHMIIPMIVGQQKVPPTSTNQSF